MRTEVVERRVVEDTDDAYARSRSTELKVYPTGKTTSTWREEVSLNEILCRYRFWPQSGDLQWLQLKKVMEQELKLLQEKQQQQDRTSYEQ